MRKINVLLIFILLFSFSLVLAHQPRLVMDTPNSENNLFQVNNPEVSQAYYGQLKGTPEYYMINSEQDFQLYLGILSPQFTDTTANNEYKDFSFDISGTINQKVDGRNYQWTSFHEDFANDDYWQGPEFRKNVSAGNYLIKVYNPNNEGRYVLVVGEKEKFPLNEALNTVVLMPELKTKFFGKSIFSSYNNKIGGFLLIILIIIIFVIVLWVLNYQKKHRKYVKHKPKIKW